MITLNESSSRLSQFQASLNRPEILPDRAFRREDPNYQLVSYVNNVTGLLLSSNFDSIPNLIARACEHIRKFPAKTPRCENYYSVVSNYLSHAIFHLESFANQSGYFDEDRIGEDVLRGGQKQAPELGVERDSLPNEQPDQTGLPFRDCPLPANSGRSRRIELTATGRQTRRKT